MYHATFCIETVCNDFVVFRITVLEMAE